jgi:acetylornithine deacetylase
MSHDSDHSFDPIEFLVEAVACPSNDGVEKMRQLLVATLENHNIDAHVDSAGNTIATRGNKRDIAEPTRANSNNSESALGTHLVLNTHIDTVSPHIPLNRDQSQSHQSPPKTDTGTDTTLHSDTSIAADVSTEDMTESDRIYGRGACDAKGPLAAMLTAFLSAHLPANATLTLAVTPDEEVLSTGAAALDLDADMYIVGEPTGLDVCTAAKGRFQGTLTLTGTAAHAAAPTTGVNAIAAVEDALKAIRTYDAGRPNATHPQLGRPTLTPTTIDGGTATNQVPATCRVVLDRRSVPPETADAFREKLTTAVMTAVSEEIGINFTLTDRPTPFLEAFATDPNHELVTTLIDIIKQTGESTQQRCFTAATEASYFAPAPVVVFGPGVLADDTGAVAHADREYVTASSVMKASRVLTDAIQRLIDTNDTQS